MQAAGSVRSASCWFAFSPAPQFWLTSTSILSLMGIQALSLQMFQLQVLPLHIAVLWAVAQAQTLVMVALAMPPVTDIIGPRIHLPTQSATLTT